MILGVLDIRPGCRIYSPKELLSGLWACHRIIMMRLGWFQKDLKLLTWEPGTELFKPLFVSVPRILLEIFDSFQGPELIVAWCFA